MMNSIFKNIFPKTPSNFKKVIRETLNILPEKCDNKKVKVKKWLRRESIWGHWKSAFRNKRPKKFF